MPKKRNPLDDEPVTISHTGRSEPWRNSWKVDLYWGEVNGRTECVGIELKSFVWEDEANAPPRERAVYPINAHGLKALSKTFLAREFSFDEILDEARDAWVQMLRTFEPFARDDKTRRTLERRLLAEQSRTARRGGRPAPDAALLMRVAAIYESAWENPSTRHAPTKTVADVLDIPHSTAAKYVQRARQARLLGQTKQGHPGIGRQTKRKQKGQEQ